jgi:hypothetical protein
MLIKSSWTWTGLVAMAALLGGANLAMAAGTPQSGIIIKTGSFAPVGDPSYAYIFDIELAAGSTLVSGGYITVYDLPDITQSSLTSQPNFYWGSSKQLLGYTPAGLSLPFTDNPNLYNVTWHYLGATIDNSAGSAPVDLGDFAIGPIPQSTPSVTLNYVGTTNGTSGQADTGSITVTAIPEPSSLALLLTAMVGVPLLVLRSRQRRCAMAV